MFIKLVITLLSLLSLLHNRARCSGLGQETLQPLPPTPDYKAAGVKYEDGGLGPLFNFARSFINTALPGGLPVEFMKKTIDDPGSLISNPMQLLQMFKGYVAAVAVGLLFIIIVPLVGMCFCCCRLCGNCGGNRHQKQSDSIHCKRRVFAGIVFVTTVFTLVGNICTYVSNDRMTTALGKVGDIVDRNLDDIDTFLDHTVNQTEILGVVNFGITRKAIMDKLDTNKMKDDISTFVVNEIAEGAMDKMEEHMKETRAAFDAVKKHIDEATNAWTSCGASCNRLQNPSLILPQSTINQFTTFTKEDPVIKVKEEIGSKVATSLGSLSSINTQVEKSFNEMEKTVTEYVDKIKNFKTKAADGIDIPAYKRDVKSYTDTAKQYDKYRHMGGVILSAVITLVVSLQMFGLVFGSVGQGLRTAPTERGCVSNSGGNFLIASVAFIFLFSWLLMLLTTLSFAVGSLLERFVCQPLAPPDFQFLTIAESKLDTNATLGASLGDILRDCRDGKSAYNAFHLKSKFDIEQVDRLLNDKLTTIQNTTQGKLNSISTLDTGASTTKANDSLNTLKNILDSIQLNTFSSLRSSVDLLPNSPPAIMDYKKAMSDLGSALDQLKSISGQVDGWKTSFNNSLELVKTKLPTQLTTILQKFNNELSRVAQVYVNSTKNSILTEVGQCTPLWNLYDSIIVVSFCNYIVDAFNGFWFSIGWCLFFFMPSIIFSVKLAKHYRTMEEDDEEKTSGQAVSNMAYESNNHLIQSNKVGHKDEPEPENKV